MNFETISALADIFTPSDSPSPAAMAGRSKYDAVMAEYNWNGWQIWKKPVPADHAATELMAKGLAVQEYRRVIRDCVSTNCMSK